VEVDLRSLEESCARLDPSLCFIHLCLYALTLEPASNCTPESLKLGLIELSGPLGKRGRFSKELEDAQVPPVSALSLFGDCSLAAFPSRDTAGDDHVASHVEDSAAHVKNPVNAKHHAN